MPSSGYGNFMEIGPLDINFQKRNYSIIQDFNVLFVDNPVGVGYSYVESNETKTPKNNEEIGEDLFRFLKIFMNKKEDFQNVPLYIFGESYGGKMVVEFASQIAKVNNRIFELHLDKTIENLYPLFIRRRRSISRSGI